MARQVIDYLNAAEIIAFYEETRQDNVYPGEFLFPSQKQNALKVAEIQGLKGLPILLKPSAYGAEPELRRRGEKAIVERELIFFREAMQLKEDQRRELFAMEQVARATGNTAILESYIETVMEDRAELIDGARARCEKARMDVLTDGRITFNEAGVQKDFDYAIETKGNAATNWTAAASATPIQDLVAATDAVSGTTLTNALMSKKTFRDFLATNELRTFVQGAAETPIPIITGDMAINAVEQFTGLRITVMDRMYIDKDGNEVPFFKDDVVTLIPSGAIGATVFAPTPEEYDYTMSTELATPDMQMELYDNAIAVISQYKKIVPVTIMTTVAMEMVPALNRRNGIYILSTRAA